MVESNSKTVTIDAEDAEFLRLLSRSLNHQIRLWWTPGPTRRNPKVEPTEVTITAEEACFVGYTLYELKKDRNKRGVATAQAEEAVIRKASVEDKVGSSVS